MSRWWFVAALAGVLLPAVANAQSGALVHLELHCPSLTEEDVRRVLAAELNTDLVAWDSNWVTVVEVACDDETTRVLVRDPVTRKTMHRGLNLEKVPVRSRERLLALAAAEMVIASWSELEVVGTPAVEPTGSPPPTEVVDAAREIVDVELSDTEKVSQQRRGPQRHGRTFREKAEHRMVPLLSVRSFVNHPGALWGGGARYGAELPSVFSFSLDGLVEGGSITGEHADIDVTSVTLSGQIDFSYVGHYGAARTGAGLRFGLLHAEVASEGNPTSNSSVVPWGWPMLVASFDIFLSSRAVFEAGAEGGYVLVPLPGGGEPSLEGVWLSGQMGFGWRW